MIAAFKRAFAKGSQRIREFHHAAFILLVVRGDRKRKSQPAGIIVGGIVESVFINGCQIVRQINALEVFVLCKALFGNPAERMRQIKLLNRCISEGKGSDGSDTVRNE